MSSRSGLGPVFAFEWLTRSRRWQGYALRGLFVLALLVALWLVWRSATGKQSLTTRQQLAEAGAVFFATMTVIQLSLILLAAPAATAGAICLDKARGSLAHVMVTDLSDREVVLGKLAARLVPVLNLIACALPVAALGTLMGGIDPMALTGSFLIAVGVALLGCSLALALSVWLTKTHEVMIVVFGLWTTWLMALPWCWMVSSGTWAPYWAECSNPFWLAMAPYSAPRRTSMVEPIVFFLACLALSVGLAALAVARLRPVYLHQADRVPKAVKDSKAAAWFRDQVRWWPGPSLDANPVLWREWHRSRPSRVVRVVWGLYVATTSVVSLMIIHDCWNVDTPGLLGRVMGSVFNGFQVSIGLMLMAASAGTVLSEERVRGSLDVLLATPLSTPSIVRGKWWGAFRRAPWLAFWPTLIALATLPSNPPGRVVAFVYLIPVLILAQGAALAGLGLALATWIPQTGRAATLTVVVLVVSIVGWPIVGSQMPVTSSSTNNQHLQTAVEMGSAFWNVGFTTNLIEQYRSQNGMPGPITDGALLGLVGWGLIYASAAAGLFVATLLTFERCLGRTSGRLGFAPHVPRDPRLKPVIPIEELDEVTA